MAVLASVMVVAAVVVLAASERGGASSLATTSLRSFHVTGSLELPHHHEKTYDDDDADLENEVDDLQDEMTTVQSDLRKLFAQRRKPGPPGPLGPRGRTGAPGKNGRRGRTGARGAAGKNGRNGKNGKNGRRGPRGRTGKQGKTGPQGVAGAVGPTGAIGPIGVQGPVGPVGAVGPKGDTGPAGPPGARGAPGPVGPTGPSGAAGVVGPAGTDGRNGAQGPPGKPGRAGATGPRGPRGRNGRHGRNGRRGRRGPRGPRGPRGRAGRTSVVHRHHRTVSVVHRHHHHHHRAAPSRGKRGYLVHYWHYGHAIRHLGGLFRGAPIKKWHSGAHHINVPPGRHSFRGVTRHDRFALRIHAVFYVPRTGRYRFHVGSDDGSNLFVDGSRVVHNDGLHGMRWRAGSRHLKRGKHHLRVDFFENGGHAGLGVKWDGPGVRHQWLPVYRPGGRKTRSSTRTSKFHGPVSIFWGTQVDRSREGKFVESAIKRVRGVTRVNRFTSTAARSWLDVRKSGAVVIPELERGSLRLGTAARRALRSSVAAGAALIVMGSMQGTKFINSVFGTRLHYRFSHCTAKKTSHARGTRFGRLRSTLHYKNAVFGIKTSSLGRQFKSMFQCSSDRTTVATMKHGKGHVFYLGFDWFENSHDKQWVSVLEAALKH